MRNINELLSIVYDNMNQYFTNYCNGIGLVVEFIYIDDIISNEERKVLRNYIEVHRPKKLRAITKNGYYWKSGRKAPRMRWLRKHIKIARKFININP